MLACIWFGASPVEGAGDGLFEVVWESDIDITMLVSRPSLRVVKVFVALVRIIRRNYLHYRASVTLTDCGGESEMTYGWCGWGNVSSTATDRHCVRYFRRSLANTVNMSNASDHTGQHRSGLIIRICDCYYNVLP